MISMMLKLKRTGGIDGCLMDYHRLVARVDRMVQRLRRKYAAHIACHKGCACGCRNLSVMPIEALSLSGAVQDLPQGLKAKILKRASTASFWDCPLLQDGACSLYAFRPIICRTHGYPLLTYYQGQPSIGYCRHNFKNIPSIPADAVIDIEKINSTLRSINASAVAEPFHRLKSPDRLSISEAILLGRHF
jgi:Fe-S-cluster containining protein